jgi:hypothetical protein
MRRAGPFFEAVIRLRRFLTIAFVLLAVGATMFARTGGRGAAQPEKKVVDLKADVMYPIEFRDTSAVCLVGNVAFYHSGAVITCDSAVRYSEKHMECFGNVLINKNDTYVYGDRADYNGETHVANVYSDLVKVVDGDATLYTYKFLFNTKTNVGEFADGGVVTNRENQLESDRGYYYANDRTVICVDRVEIRSEEYDLTGDSVVYNLTTDHAYYFRHTNIWNTQGDYLYADRGSYDKGGELYTVTENGYILTEKQEVWSDSIDYYKLAGHAVLRGNIQIDDTEHKVLAFGDFGEYWKEPGNAFLTRRPAVVSYDTSQGDSLFMAADSMFLYTIDPARQRADSLRAAARAADSLHADSLRTDSLRVDSLAPAAGDSVQGVRPEAPIVAARRGSLSEGRGDAKRNGTERTDSLAPRRADSLRRDSLAADSLSLDSLGLTPADSLDSLARDTIYRLVKGFRNVRIYRSDFQSVCDSLVAVSRDSTIHLYIDPVLWNQNSQITSDVMDIFTANSQIVRAEFVGRPLMVSELDTMHYNQVAGKTMTALFRNNQIYRNDVKGNAQTIYFMQEDDSPDIIGLLVLESGDLTFFIEEKQVVKITYRNNPVYTIYPMDKIPPDVDLFLKDFKWEAKRRPAQRDVFDRTIRPSIRAAKSSQSRPQFPIAARIDAFKRRLIESRRWSDRNDVVQPDVIEWMYSLGWRPPEQEEENLPVVPLAGNAKETSP